jgi:hypothetical protein
MTHNPYSFTCVVEMIKYGCEVCDFVFHATHSCPIHEDLENVPSSVQNVAIAKFRDYH